MRALLLVVSFLFSCVTMADQNQPISNEACQQVQSSTGLSNDQVAQQGCCSHHGGVCGCSGGQDVCCDGAYSPSCGCHAEDPKSFLRPNEAEQPKS